MWGISLEKTSPAVEDISCMRNWRHPGLLPKQYVALCVLDAIVSPLLPNIFVLIGLAALSKALVFLFFPCFCFVSRKRAKQKSRFVANKTQRRTTRTNDLFLFKRWSPIWSQHGWRRWRWFFWPVWVYMQPWRSNAEVDFFGKFEWYLLSYLNAQQIFYEQKIWTCYGESCIPREYSSEWV